MPRWTCICKYGAAHTFANTPSSAPAQAPMRGGGSLNFYEFTIKLVFVGEKIIKIRKFHFFLRNVKKRWPAVLLVRAGCKVVYVYQCWNQPHFFVFSVYLNNEFRILIDFSSAPIVHKYTVFFSKIFDILKVVRGEKCSLQLSIFMKHNQNISLRNEYCYVGCFFRILPQLYLEQS